MTLMRLFAAIELPEPIRKHLEQIQDRLRDIAPKASWTRGENLHITLKFIGEIPNEQVDALCRALRSVEPVPAMELRSRGVVLFPPRGPVRIIAGAFEGDVARLTELHQKVDAACAEFGVARELRAFTPHATLARAMQPILPTKRARLLPAAGDDAGPTFTADSFVLMMSDLQPTGARYTPIARFGSAV